MNLKDFIEIYGDNFGYPLTLVNQDQKDQPLVYVNKFFQELTGYQEHEVLGKNCRLLQKGKPDPEANARIRTAITARQPLCQDLINYKKNGEILYNRLVMIPSRIQATKYILGLQHEIPANKYKPKNEVPPHELADKTITPLSVMLSLELVADSRFNDEFQLMIRKIQKFVLSL